VKPALVVPVDPAGDGVLDVGEGLVGALVEDHRADAFGLEQTDDDFDQAVVVGVTVPIEGAMPSRDRCSVKRIEVYWLPASL
jgi:hypothetical protein